MLSDESASKIRTRFLEKKYAEAPEMVSPEISKLLYDFGHLLRRNPTKYLTKDESDYDVTGSRDGSCGRYGLQISELLLLYFKADYEKILGKKLVPTYTYTRKYVQGGSLIKHSDRPACQYSITLNITASNDEPWPFFCQKKDERTQTKIHNQLHVPIIYMGEDVVHWREPLQKEFSFHVFLHYVDANDDKYREHWYDKRAYFG